MAGRKSAGRSGNGKGVPVKQRTHDIIVIGASAGGVEALKELVGGFPPDLAASVFVALHIAPTSPGILPDILRPVRAAPGGSPEEWGGDSSRPNLCGPPRSPSDLGAGLYLGDAGAARERSSSGGRSPFSSRGARLWSPCGRRGPDRVARLRNRRFDVDQSPRRGGRRSRPA